jgi:predicted membrane protein
MNRKSLFGIIISVLIFCAIILAIETSISIWQVALGFIVFWPLTLGFANFRNSFILLIMTLLLLLTIYLSFKFSWLGVVPGAVVGIITGFLMHLGWIIPLKPFSRAEYIKSQGNS